MGENNQALKCPTMQFQSARNAIIYLNTKISIITLLKTFERKCDRLIGKIFYQTMPFTAL